jgi:hypothetical protein
VKTFIRCAVCKYLRFRMPEGQSRVATLLKDGGVVQVSYYCTNEEVIRQYGDGVNPLELGKREISLVNQAYEWTPCAKANRTPREIWLTQNVQPRPRRWAVVDSIEKLEHLDEMVASVRDTILSVMEDVVEDADNTTYEELERVVRMARESDLVGSGAGMWHPTKKDVYAWLRSQLYGIGCSIGATNFSRDKTKLPITVKVTVI